MPQISGADSSTQEALPPVSSLPSSPQEIKIDPDAYLCQLRFWADTVKYWEVNVPGRPSIVKNLSATPEIQRC